MNTKDTLHALDTVAALSQLEIPFEDKGAYLSFPCPNCKEKAVIKTYGEKKNLYFCPKCKKGHNVIQLALVTKGLTGNDAWNEAKAMLAKALTAQPKPITEELQLNYELEYVKALEERGFTQDFCKAMGVGQPKHRNMLAGHIAFTVFDEEGKKVAYYGIKDGKPKFHSSFSPENYLYLFNAIDKEAITVLVPDLLDCLKLISQGVQAVSNFGLPYLSPRHLELLNQCKLLNVARSHTEIVKQLAANYDGYVKFI